MNENELLKEIVVFIKALHQAKCCANRRYVKIIENKLSKLTKLYKLNYII